MRGNVEKGLVSKKEKENTVRPRPLDAVRFHLRLRRKIYHNCEPNTTSHQSIYHPPNWKHDNNNPKNSNESNNPGLSMRATRNGGTKAGLFDHDQSFFAPTRSCTSCFSSPWRYQHQEESFLQRSAIIIAIQQQQFIYS